MVTSSRAEDPARDESVPSQQPPASCDVPGMVESCHGGAGKFLSVACPVDLHSFGKNTTALALADFARDLLLRAAGERRLRSNAVESVVRQGLAGFG